MIQRGRDTEEETEGRNRGEETEGKRQWERHKSNGKKDTEANR